MRHATDLCIGLIGIATAGAVWSAVTYGDMVKPLFLPSPTGVWDALLEFHERGWLMSAIIRSVYRVITSLAFVTVIGVPIGLAMGAFATVDAFLRRLIQGAKSVPVTGLVGLIVLWFSIEERAKIVFLVLGSIFYMILLVRNAVRSVSQEYVDLALNIGANKWQVVSRILLPAAFPQIWEAIAICNGLMWTYIVLAEFLNSNESQMGLGYLIYLGARTQNAGKVFAALLLISVISGTTEWCFWRIRRLIPG
jgi:NitT/TauT family transport system permease protein